MPTEDDLRTTLAELEDESPDVGSVLADTYRRHHRRTIRRRVTGMVAAAAVTVLLAAASIAVPKLLSSPPAAPPASPPSEPWRFPFTVDSAPGVQVRGLHLGADRYLAQLHTDRYFKAEVYMTGRYDLPKSFTAEIVGVNRKRALYWVGQFTGARDSDAPKNAILAWEYMPNAWAVLSSVDDHSSQPRDPHVIQELLRLAELFRFDASTPLRVPYRLGYLPTGLRPAASNGLGSMAYGQRSSVQLAGIEPNSPDLNIGTLLRPGGPSSNTEARVYRADDNVGTHVTRAFGASEVNITSGGEGKPRFSTDELLKIANSMVPVADWMNTDNWVEAEKVLPTG